MAGDDAVVHDLAEARPDAWLEDVLDKSSDYERVAQIIGRSTLGLALVAGIRISSLAVDPRIPELTMIEYRVPDDPDVRQATLTEFRGRIASELLVPIQDKPLPSEPSTAQLQAHIGGRYLLAASLFEVQPLTLERKEGHSEISVEFNEIRHVLSLDHFREIIDERIRAELRISESAEGNGFDLGAVERAQQAHAQEEWDVAIELLSPLLVPVSMLLRTGEAAVLSQQVHETISTGLELLGTAHANDGQFSMASDVLRLGVQWVGDSAKAADLFLSLGDACMRAGKPGEAIGLLRRALKLGADSGQALQSLAQCLHEREQYLAALVCLDRAAAAGAGAEALQGLREAVVSHLGEDWLAFERWMRTDESQCPS